MSGRYRLATIIGMVFLGLVVFAGIGMFVWVSDVAEPMPEALEALISDEAVTVTTEPWLIFEPTGVAPESGFIFYPGGKVDPRAYAPAARAIAEAGHLAVIVPMPLNLAVLAPDRADQVRDAFPAIKSWAIGGHSLGGTMAASYASKASAPVDALVLWAAYPAGGSSLADRDDLRVGSIYGALDGLVTATEIDESRALLPSTTTWSPIKGGNHAKFGWYGPQDGDNPAAITRAQQQAEAVSATLALITAAP